MGFAGRVDSAVYAANVVPCLACDVRDKCTGQTLSLDAMKMRIDHDIDQTQRVISAWPPSARRYNA
jgi:hypothetical protein